MVHALEEARRVLVPQGILVDLRPYCVEVPLELVFHEGIESVARLDSSPSRPDDLAADQAFESAAQAGMIKELKSEYFFFDFYWDTVQDMQVDWEDKWWSDVVLPKKVLRRAARMYKEHPGSPRLRIRIRSKLVVYEKPERQNDLD